MMLADTFLFAAIFLFGMAAGGAIMHVLFGPDPDLAGPWDPYAEDCPTCDRRMLDAYAGRRARR